MEKPPRLVSRCCYELPSFGQVLVYPSHLKDVEAMPLSFIDPPLDLFSAGSLIAQRKSHYPPETLTNRLTMLCSLLLDSTKVSRRLE